MSKITFTIFAPTPQQMTHQPPNCAFLPLLANPNWLLHDLLPVGIPSRIVLPEGTHLRCPPHIPQVSEAWLSTPLSLLHYLLLHQRQPTILVSKLHLNLTSVPSGLITYLKDSYIYFPWMDNCADLMAESGQESHMKHKKKHKEGGREGV